MRKLMVRGMVLVAALLVLAGCGKPEAVHFFEQGQPATLDEWHVLRIRDGRLSLNDGVVPYDLNTPLFSDYAHKLRTGCSRPNPRSSCAVLKPMISALVPIRRWASSSMASTAGAVVACCCPSSMWNASRC